MMEIPTKDNLVKLSGETGRFSVSLYMPTASKGVETLQNTTRLKNLLREAERKVEALGGTTAEAQQQFKEVHALLQDYDFFQHQSDGLALFIAPSGTVTKFRVPIQLEEHVHVNDRFHLKPLMRVLSSNGRFYFLALSQKNVRFLEGDRFGIKEVKLPEGTPRSLEEAMKYEDWARGHHFSAGSQGRSAGGVRPFAGHGLDASDKENAKADLLQFLQMVNKGILEVVGQSSAPLVIGGLEFMQPIARDALTYSNVVKEGVVRTTDDLTAQELHGHAWKIAEPLFHNAQDTAVERFEEFRSKGLASSNLAEVIPAAAEGRVDTLLVSADKHCWGTFEADSRKVRIKPDEGSSGGEDLLDLAAIQALMTGAQVFSVSHDEMPDNSTVAAVFRY